MKRNIALLLAVVLLFSVCPISAHAVPASAAVWDGAKQAFV